jgi:hypothetical protein
MGVDVVALYIKYASYSSSVQLQGHSKLVVL